jgi:hypothetical protein
MLVLLIVQLSLPGVMHQGDRTFYYDARSCGIGGVQLVLEHSSNPAAMGLIKNPTVTISGAIQYVNEKRGLRVYDSYGNNIGISTITNNSFTRATPSGCSFVFPFQFLRTGFQFSPIWDYSYSFYREFRDDFYQITKTVDQQYTGRTYALTPMIGFVHSWIQLGIAQRFMYGEKAFESFIIYPNGPDSIETSEYDCNGAATHCGLTLSPGMHFRLSYMYQLPYVIEVGTDALHDSFPAQHSIGFMYQPPGRIPTRFFGEMVYETWEDPLWLYKVGVEHTLLSTYVLRYGFCLYPDYTENSIWTTVLTIGIGIQQSNFLVDIGYAYGKRDYSSHNYDGLGESENLAFDESINNLVLSFTVRL